MMLGLKMTLADPCGGLKCLIVVHIIINFKCSKFVLTWEEVGHNPGVSISRISCIRADEWGS